MPEDFYENFYVLVPMEPRRDSDLKEAPPGATENDKFEDHPKWVEIQYVLMRALRPFAEAREAVVLGLGELFEGSSA
jgi:hypothetical protein